MGIHLLKLIKNLNLFKIKDLDGFENYIENEIKLDSNKEPYYNFIKESFNKDLKIYRIDNNNRFYHLLTSLERELKQFINIKLSVDCKNSHPVLFNYFIFSSKKIDINTSYRISNILFSIDQNRIRKENNHNHYDIEKLRNVLIGNNVDKSIIARFASDELLYIYQTTKGLFWDDILKEHKGEGYDRATVKEKMFAEVFYSKTKELDKKEFAQEFNTHYPNVYDLIERWKEPLNHNDLKNCMLNYNKAVKLGDIVLSSSPETALPNVMMSLESEIFREILKSLFRKRMSVVHIHDAIVLPSSQTKVDIEMITDVMRAIYKKYGLHPTFSIDTY